MIYVSNAIDDVIRQERGITTDSPAASRKAFLISRAVMTVGTRSVILSLGRGRNLKGRKYFSAKVRRVGGVIVYYAPFRQGPYLSYAISFLAPALMLLYLHCRLKGKKALVFHNRAFAFLPVLFLGTLLGFRRVLNFEDAEVGLSMRLFSGWMKRTTIYLFDNLCNGGALLITSTLASKTRLKPTICFHATVENLSWLHDWKARPIVALMCGALWHETGAELLIDALKKMRRDSPVWCQDLKIIVTGHGPFLDAYSDLASEKKGPIVEVFGRTTNDEYKKILKESHIGLALKLNEGKLADTTFPSKVIEFANAGLLVLSTDISDVRRVLGETALYLESDDTDQLIDLLRWAVVNPVIASLMAKSGADLVWEKMSPAKAGQALSDFCFPPANAA